MRNNSMRNKMILIIGAVVILFGALYFVIDYKNKKALDGVDHPYGDKKLHQATIDQLDDPLYDKVILADTLQTELDEGKDMTVYFYSSTCIHCSNTTPVLVPVTEKLDIDMKKVNLEEEKNSAWNQFEITGTPTLVQYKDGEEVARISGEQPAEVFESFLKENTVD